VGVASSILQKRSVNKARLRARFVQINFLADKKAATPH